MKKFLKGLLASVLMVANLVTAQNLGFEDGNTTGWTSSTLSAVGSTTTQAGPNTWVINPYGSYMGQLQIQSGSFNQMTSALGLTSSSSTGITTLLQQQAATGGGNPTPTTAGWVTRQVALTAGQTFTLAWQYVSVDYVPYNDGSIATLTQNGTDVATVNNYNQQYALLGFTNPGTGDYSTGSYGATGWQVATFQVSVSGTYTLGFGVFNLGDTALSPVLYIDEVQGTTTLNGQSFGAVAPNNSTAPTSPVSGGGGGGGGGTPSPISTVDSNTTVDTSNLASSVTVNGGTIQIASNNITLTNTFTTDTNGMTIDQNGNTVDFSGVISGSGGVTISNSGTGGGVTFSAVNTYTGTTTINSGAGLQNTGTIAGDVTNLGTFLNTGTAGNVTNGFNGDGNTAVAVNSGTVGNVTNWSTFTNSGTTGDVTNFGTFTNTGNVGTFNNAGVLNNNSGGVINELGYNNFWVQNSGTINNITYNGGTVINNPDGTIGTINNTEAHGIFYNYGTVTGNVTTNSTFNNEQGGVVQGLYTNNGTLNNAGTVGAWINNVDATINNSGIMGNGTNSGTMTNSAGGVVGNVANTGTLTNNGTVGSVTSSGTFDNNGTAGDVTLTGGTFTNAGTAASVDNTAGLTFTNGGTITGLLTNSGTVTNNGSVGSVNNTGTYTNNGTTGNWTNGAAMTNAGTMGNGTNTGTMTNSGNVGTVNNTGTFINNAAGVTGDWTNSATMTNAGTMGNGINTGTYSNTGTVGTVDNTGTMTTSGTTGLITNSGTLTVSGGIASVNNTGTLTVSGGTLDSYTQSTPGSTLMNFDTPITVTNNASLGGSLGINGAPTAYGRYTVISAGSVNGIYGSFTSAGVNDYLRYSGTDVKLYVTPSSSQTQSNINSISSNLGNAINLQSAMATNALGSDCAVWGSTGSCVGVNLGRSAAAGGDLNTGGITVGKKLGNNWRMGVFTNSPFNTTTVGSIGVKSNSAYGGYVGWNKNADGKGLGITASVAQGTGSMNITRNGPEVGRGTSNTDTKAYQVKGTYSIPASETVTVAPYMGFRHTATTLSGYTESGPVFPLTVNGTSQTANSILAGVGVNKQITEKLSGSVTAGVVKKISGKNASFTGSSEIGGLGSFNGDVPNNGSTNPAFGAGLGYSVTKTSRVGVNVGWQQNGTNASIATYGVSYTVGF